MPFRLNIAKLNSGFILFLSFIFSGCSHPEYGLKSIDTIEYADTTLIALRNWSSDGKLIRAFCLETAILNFFDAKTGELAESIPLTGLDSSSSERRLWGITSHSPDSIFILMPRINTLCLLNRMGKLIRKWNITGAYQTGQADYTLVHLARSPILIHNNQLIATCAQNSIPVNSIANRIIYFKTPGEIHFDLNKSNAIPESKTGYWPLSYRQGNGYRDYYPQRCINDKGQLVNGFGADDSIFVYDKGKRVEAYQVISKYMTTRKVFPDDSAGNYSFTDQYLVEEPRYLSLDYDPYRKMYYRIVHHAQQYIQNDSMTLNQTIDKKWSLMMLDANFNLVGEVLFDPKQFMPSVLITSEGLLIQQRQEPLVLPKAKFTLFLPELL